MCKRIKGTCIQIGGKNETCLGELLKRTLDNIRRDKCFDCIYNTNTEEEQNINNSVFEKEKHVSKLQELEEKTLCNFDERAKFLGEIETEMWN